MIQIRARRSERGVGALLRVVVLAFAATSSGVFARPQAVTSSSSILTTATSSGATSVPAPSITLSTSVPAPTAPLTNDLPAPAPLPPAQAWCPSKIFCAGELLQTVNIAALYADPKTFVDKPTNKSSAAVLADFNSILTAASNNTANVTEGQLETFVETDFRGEGLELEALPLTNFLENPPFLGNVTDPLVNAFAKTVHGFWTQLIRGTNKSTLCGEGTNSGTCESTLIPLNHTFVVPGGRFREQYYWDSYWIIQGLIQSRLFDTVNATLQNFMDELEDFGFIPNGGRIYYLNRSQPPLFIRMLADYVMNSNDFSILTRALPLAERELAWWHTNRTLNVSSPFTNKTYSVSRYAVNNTAPRPESYLTDYLTANGPDITTPLNESQKEELYSELASGAETGWDYTVRFASQPTAGGTNDTNPVLRSLNIKGTVPICLNSILYGAHTLLAQLYEPPFSSSSNTNNRNMAASHRTAAANLKSAILDLMWDPSKLAFYDFNLTSNSRNTIFTTAHFYPMWNGIIPNELLSNETAAFAAFSSVNLVMNRYNGTFPTTFIDSGLQWDAPNSWPPHQFIAIQALRALPSNVTTKPVPTPGSGQSTFSLIPSGQLGLSEGDLPGQPLKLGGNSTTADLNALNGTVANGGNATAGETWAVTLQREMANRYMTSALCSWHATGGSIPGVLPRLSDAELQVTQSQNNTGNMFEKFSYSDVDSAGQGGEYTVQAGFGWTNGVVLWIASNYGKTLVAPNCPPLLVQTSSNGGNSSSGGSGSGSPGGSNSNFSVRLEPSVKASSAVLISLLVSTILATIL